MNHITQEQVAKLMRERGLLALYQEVTQSHQLCNAAIEWHIAQQAAPDPLVCDDWVICPQCCSQFRAIPVNVQIQIGKLVEALERAESSLSDYQQDVAFHEYDADVLNEVRAALDLYKSEPKTNTSQEPVQKTGESEQVPLTQSEVVEEFCKLKHNTQYVTVFDAGVRYAEKHHGIGGKV